MFGIDDAIVGAAILGGTQLIGSAMSGGDSATQTTSSAPAPRDADQTRFWNDFVNTWYGVDPKASGTAKAPAGDSSGIYWDMPEYFPQQALQWLQQEYEAGNIDKQTFDKYASLIDPSDPAYNPYADVVSPGGFPLSQRPDDAKTLRDFITSQTAVSPTAPTGDEGESGEKPKSYKDMLTEDIGYQQAAGEEYLDTLEGLGTEKTTGYQTATDTYNTLLTDLLSDTTAQDLLTPVTLRFGGVTSDVVPGSRRRAADTYTNILGQKQGFGREQYGVGTALADTKYTTGKDLARETRTQKQTYTPNAANIAYLTALMDVVNRQEDRRYKTPTTSTTAEASTDWGTEIANAINSGLDIYKAFK